MSFVVLAGLLLPPVSAVEAAKSDTPVIVRDRSWTVRGDPTFVFGLGGDIPVMGDWNGDGTATPGVFRQGRWYLRNKLASGATDVRFTFDRAGDVAVVGDWDGDGRTTVGVVRGRNWYLRDNLTARSANRTFAFGGCGDTELSTASAGTSPGVPSSLRGTEWTRLPSSEKVVALS